MSNPIYRINTVLIYLPIDIYHTKHQLNVVNLPNPWIGLLHEKGVIFLQHQVPNLVGDRPQCSAYSEI